MSRDSGSDQGLGTQVNELLGLVIAYAKQETLVPLRGLARFIGLGLAGAVLLAAGGALATLTAVRAVQSEAGGHLAGNLSWVPYFGGVVVAAAGMGWAAARILRRRM